MPLTIEGTQHTYFLTDEVKNIDELIGETVPYVFYLDATGKPRCCEREPGDEAPYGYEILHKEHNPSGLYAIGYGRDFSGERVTITNNTPGAEKPVAEIYFDGALLATIGYDRRHPSYHAADMLALSMVKAAEKWWDTVRAVRVEPIDSRTYGASETTEEPAFATPTNEDNEPRYKQSQVVL